MYCHLTGLPGSEPEDRLDGLIVFADRMGIERVILYKDESMPLDPSPTQLQEHNDRLMRLVERRPQRIMGYAYVNPKLVEDSVREIDRCVRDGPLVGIKLFVSAKAHAPSVETIVERAGALDALIFQHTWLKVGGDPPYPGGGNRETESTPMDLARLAARFPNVAFVCGHAGADFELGLQAVQRYPNVYVGVAGYDPTAGVAERAVDLLGSHRICYSSDFPGRSFGSQLAKIKGGRIPNAAKQRILGENLRTLLRPILERKGLTVD